MKKTTAATLILFVTLLGLTVCSQPPTPTILAHRPFPKPIAALPTTTSILGPLATVAPSPTVVSSSLPSVEALHTYSARFVMTDTVAYLDHDNLYVYHLMTRSAQQITDGENTSSFDWSKSQQAFAVAKGGHLLLFTITGKLLADLSTPLAASSAQLGAGGCDIDGRLMGRQVSLLEQVSWVAWNPDGSHLLFASDIYAGNQFSIDDLVFGQRHK